MTNMWMTFDLYVKNMWTGVLRDSYVNESWLICGWCVNGWERWLIMWMRMMCEWGWGMIHIWNTDDLCHTCIIWKTDDLCIYICLMFNIWIIPHMKDRWLVYEFYVNGCDVWLIMWMWMKCEWLGEMTHRCLIDNVYVDGVHPPSPSKFTPFYLEGLVQSMFLSADPRALLCKRHV